MLAPREKGEDPEAALVFAEPKRLLADLAAPWLLFDEPRALPKVDEPPLAVLLLTAPKSEVDGLSPAGACWFPDAKRESPEPAVDVGVLDPSEGLELPKLNAILSVLSAENTLSTLREAATRAA